MRNVVWFSCGAASTVALKIVLGEDPKCVACYCDTGGEHPDNMRFLRDVSDWLGVRINVLKNDKYADHFDVIDKTRYINGPGGARCTVELKKKPRFEFQRADDIQSFGYTVDEKHRAERFVESFPEVNARFPLIERGFTKQQCIGILWSAGIEIPKMYTLGFNNNNCIGCVKGGAGYWNKIRREFPEHFERMSDLEQKIGRSCIKGTFLKDLSPKAGNHRDMEISCDFVCSGFDADERIRRMK